MNRRKMKKTVCLMLAALMAVSGTGCAKSELTGMSEEEKNLYVQYSANLILRHDKNYIDRMTYVEAESETETEVQTSSNVAGTDSQNQAGVSDSSAALTDMNSLFQVNGLDIQPAGYEVTDSYPSASSGLGMSMVAVKGYRLLVLKFAVTNTGGTDVALDMLGTKAEYKGIINDSVRMNAQVTALLNALNTYRGTIPAGGSTELVLVFQINENDADNIGSVKLNLTYNDKQGTVVIQ